MPETASSRRPHHSHRHSERHDPGHGEQRTILEPVLYFAGAILMLIAARLMHASLPAPALGALGIIVLSISKIWKSKPGILASLACLAGMILVYIWHWISSYYSLALAVETLPEFSRFTGILAEGAIIAFMSWLFHRLYYATYHRLGEKWFVKKTYVILLKLLYYLMLFLVLFWLLAFILGLAKPVTNLSSQDGLMVAAALALLASGIPAIVYIARNSPHERRRHSSSRHHHRHRRTESEETSASK